MGESGRNVTRGGGHDRKGCGYVDAGICTAQEKKFSDELRQKLVGYTRAFVWLDLYVASEDENIAYCDERAWTVEVLGYDLDFAPPFTCAEGDFLEVPYVCTR